MAVLNCACCQGTAQVSTVEMLGTSCVVERASAKRGKRQSQELCADVDLAARRVLGLKARKCSGERQARRECVEWQANEAAQWPRLQCACACSLACGLLVDEVDIAIDLERCGERVVSNVVGARERLAERLHRLLRIRKTLRNVVHRLVSRDRATRKDTESDGSHARTSAAVAGAPQLLLASLLSVSCCSAAVCVCVCVCSDYSLSAASKGSQSRTSGTPSPPSLLGRPRPMEYSSSPKLDSKPAPYALRVTPSSA